MFKRMLLLLLISCRMIGDAAQAQESARFRPLNAAEFRADDLLAQHFWKLAAQNARDARGVRLLAYEDASINEPERLAYISVTGSLTAGVPYAIDSALALLPGLHSAPQQERLSLAIAQYYFREGKLAAAIPFYERAGIGNLSNAEISDAKFERAYAYFNNRQLSKADTLFRIMKDVPGKYYAPGNYYYGLLAYNGGDFSAALKSFERIKAELLYKPVVPYYIAELYYFSGERERALTAALSLTQESDKSYYDKELHLLAAQCLFEAGRYGDALPYFEYYYERTDKIRKEELYEIGYSYYRVSEWKNAIEKFKPLSAAQDSLGQTAMYLLGDSYLKTGNKEAARNAFGVCAGMPFSAGQREASLLLHGKLSYELGYSDDAMRSVRTLLTDFPAGKYKAQGKVLQSQLYLQTSNYKDAYESLTSGEVSTGNEYIMARTRAALGYALQEIEQQHPGHANALLDDVLTSAMTSGTATFWKGELAYRLRHYDTAVKFAEQYLAMNPTDADRVANRANAALMLGYAAMETKDFKKAQAAFAEAKKAGVSASGTADITLREADAFFMQKDFNHAAPLYAEASQGTGANADYARLQSAVLAGLRGNGAEKERLLQSILTTTPPSSYAAEARYELGVAQIGASKFSEAIATLSPLTADKNKNAFASKALLKTGTAQQQSDKPDAALQSYTHIIREWPNSPERGDALSAIKSIYIERNQPDAYTKLLRDNNLPQATDTELDAAYYNAAEAQYAAAKWTEAGKGFTRYLQVYPAGLSAGKARYYLASSLYNGAQYRLARTQYDTLLQGSWGAFSEESARRAAELAVADSAIAKAAGYYAMLAVHAGNGPTKALSYTGLMRMAERVDSTGLAAAYADTLLTLQNVAPAVRDEAQLAIVRRIITSSAPADADSLLRPLAESSNGAVAVEARYYLAQNLLLAGKLKEAEEAASKNIKRSAGYDYEVVRTYILLGDILTAEKDYFNARATLQSVAQHTRFPVLKAEALRKLEGLKTRESSKLSDE